MEAGAVFMFSWESFNIWAFKLAADQQQQSKCKKLINSRYPFHDVFQLVVCWGWLPGNALLFLKLKSLIIETFYQHMNTPHQLTSWLTIAISCQNNITVVFFMLIYLFKVEGDNFSTPPPSQCFPVVVTVVAAVAKTTTWPPLTAWLLSQAKNSRTNPNFS